MGVYSSSLLFLCFAIWIAQGSQGAFEDVKSKKKSKEVAMCKIDLFDEYVQEM